uniref:Uncharacterized protein n=1 Tax=Cycas taitungensis TaxID=54799 RepID=A6H5G1_CYCTA|nr:hypothetical protein CYtaCp019 [Cycas taitungensis]BAF64927.1 hypothetical protein [Cycas taitungensis]
MLVLLSDFLQPPASFRWCKGGAGPFFFFRKYPPSMHNTPEEKDSDLSADDASPSLRYAQERYNFGRELVAPLESIRTSAPYRKSLLPFERPYQLQGSGISKRQYDKLIHLRRMQARAGLGRE